MRFGRCYKMTFPQLIRMQLSLWMQLNSIQREFAKVKYYKNEPRVLIITGRVIINIRHLYLAEVYVSQCNQITGMNYDWKARETQGCGPFPLALSSTDTRSWLLE